MNIFKRAFISAHPLIKIVFAISFAFICALLTYFITTLILNSIYDVNLLKPEAFETMLDHPDMLNILRVQQVVQGLCMFVIPTFILAYIYSHDSKKYLKLNGKMSLIAILSAVVIMLAIQPFSSLTAEFNMMLSFPDSMKAFEDAMRASEEAATKTTEVFVQVSSVQALLFNILMIGVLAAVGEELFFRGIIQKLFTDWTNNIHISVLFTAILFSAIHMQFFTFLPRLVMGILLGYMYCWSRSIWIPIIAHFFNNALGVVVFYLVHNGQVEKSIEEPEITPQLISWGFIGLGIAILFLLLLRTKEKRIL